MLIQLYSVLHMQRYKKYPTDLTVFKLFMFRSSEVNEVKGVIAPYGR